MASWASIRLNTPSLHEAAHVQGVDGGALTSSASSSSSGVGSSQGVNPGNGARTKRRGRSDHSNRSNSSNAAGGSPNSAQAISTSQGVDPGSGTRTRRRGRSDHSTRSSSNHSNRSASNHNNRSTSDHRNRSTGSNAAGGSSRLSQATHPLPDGTFQKPTHPLSNGAFRKLGLGSLPEWQQQQQPQLQQSHLPLCDSLPSRVSSPSMPVPLVRPSPHSSVAAATARGIEHVDCALPLPQGDGVPPFAGHARTPRASRPRLFSANDSGSQGPGFRVHGGDGNGGGDGGGGGGGGGNGGAADRKGSVANRKLKRQGAR
ncbi:hypothetical protein DUNSADRAFT_1216 [Dunaliella salina]|uniref:Encoded protein n=1 Tax=Dunaliella salina TaxID=3046 RepID=A0ABQ7GXE1_DUNSA|nr:hypothetical protein DUNSADRAFT_1216 [Dunaliella salina]|eukprot:KAF5839272.1 hypothetical protein DUNSADRAFT_1216 [Dunaliella salina]